MTRETDDIRRSVKRWCIAVLVVTVSAMAVIRTASVRHRAQEPRRSTRQGAELLRAASGGVTGAETAVGLAPGDASSAFQYAVCAADAIRIDGSDGGGSVVVGDIHNNALRGGEIRIDGTSDVYGRVTSRGSIVIGSSESVIVGYSGMGVPTVVYGSLRGDVIVIGGLGEVLDFEDLSEWVQGVDLNRDGDLDDLNVGLNDPNGSLDDRNGDLNDPDGSLGDRDGGGAPVVVEASRRILSGDEELSSGDTDRRIADGTRPVDITGTAPDRVTSPSPDFRLYYEMTTGITTYPPEDDHVVSEIPGDGQGHYFASASGFLGWINSQRQRDALCWRCAGDGKIDPKNETDCPTCESKGTTLAVEITGVFYIDDETLDLSAIETNLVVHGTIVVAEGNPCHPMKTAADRPGAPFRTPEGHGRAADTHRLLDSGTITVGGPTRMHLMQTYRADRDGGPYVWRHRTIHSGSDQQTIAARVPEEGHEMRRFPALVAASDIVVLPRASGFACCAGDIGDEALTVFHGVLFAGREIRIGGRGGWQGDPLVFNEEEARAEDAIIDEAVLRVDLNEDGDVFDLVAIPNVSGRPVIRVSKGRYNVDINQDGVLGAVTIGEDYGEFFAGNGYTPPTLVYLEGALMGETIQIGGQCAVMVDPLIGRSTPLVGFGTESVALGPLGSGGRR